MCDGARWQTFRVRHLQHLGVHSSGSANAEEVRAELSTSRTGPLAASEWCSVCAQPVCCAYSDTCCRQHRRPAGCPSPLSPSLSQVAGEQAALVGEWRVGTRSWRRTATSRMSEDCGHSGL